ncbi:membrane protein [Streptomyces phage MeganTheeKilla]|uniref:Membrane protein n=1 Tax=Streptomyces phage MeganTheeKilla TaxID=2801897 RepID=A0A7U0J7G0_9CAUD|nr:membrane protein [Streptomyces phage MeganTheeKilla]QZE11528.1 membrane protein [Streptomyces phage Jada]
MDILFWIWVVPAGFFTTLFLLIVLFASLINIQTGAVFGGLAIGIFGPPVAVALGALWPVTWPLFSLLGKLDEKRIEKRNQEYEKRLAKGKNYGKLMRITESHPHLPDEYLGAIVKIVQWHEPGRHNAYVEFVDQSIRPGRFYWRHSMMEEI